MRYLLVAAATVSLAAGLLTPAAPAAGVTCKPNMWGTTDTANGGLDCQNTTNNPGKPPKGAGGRTAKSTPPICVWVPAPDYVPRPGEPTEGDGGHWYAHFCRFGDFQTLDQFESETTTWDYDNIRQGNMLRRADIRYAFFKTPPEARPSADTVMFSRVGSLPYPETHLAVSPKAAVNKVNEPTWLWLTNPDGTYEPATYAPEPKVLNNPWGYDLKWQIVPELTIDPGNGSEAPTCANIGIPWAQDADPSDACTVTYTKAGTYTLTATMTWTVKWWLGAEEQAPLEGTTKAASLPITVKEIQTINR